MGRKPANQTEDVVLPVEVDQMEVEETVVSADPKTELEELKAKMSQLAAAYAMVQVNMTKTSEEIHRVVALNTTLQAENTTLKSRVEDLKNKIAVLTGKSRR